MRIHDSAPEIGNTSVISSSQTFCRRNTACTFLAAILFLLESGRGAMAFSIASVRVNPSGPITSSEEVSLTVSILTPLGAAFLRQTNEVVINRDEVVVVMHPGCGNLTEIATLTTNVALGRLRPGSYRYVVVLVPPFSVDWGSLFSAGAFNVMPQLRIGMNSEGIFLMWPSSAESFVIQYADQPGDAAEWKDLSYERDYIGEFFFVRVSRSENQKSYRLIQR